MNITEYQLKKLSIKKTKLTDQIDKEIFELTKMMSRIKVDSIENKNKVDEKREEISRLLKLYEQKTTKKEN